MQACLRAIAAQEMDIPLEVILVNDGGDALDDWLRQFPSLNITYVAFPTHRGQLAARAAALASAQGTYVAWCDDDDRWLPEHVRRLVSLQTEGDVLAYSDAEVVWLNGEHPPQLQRRAPFAWRNVSGMLFDYNPIVPSSVLYPRVLHADLGPLDVACGHYWDWDFWLRAAAAVPIRRSPVCQVLYGVWGGGVNESAEPLRMRPDLLALCEKHGLGDLPSSNFGRMATDEGIASFRDGTLVVWDGDMAIW